MARSSRPRKSKQYSKLLDIMLLAVVAAHNSDNKNAAKFLKEAAALSDFDTEVDYLDNQNDGVDPNNNAGEYADNEGSDADSFGSDFTGDDEYEDIAEESSEENSLAKALAAIDFHKKKISLRHRGYKTFASEAGDIEADDEDVNAFENSGDDSSSYDGFELSDSNLTGNETFNEQKANLRQARRERNLRRIK